MRVRRKLGVPRVSIPVQLLGKIVLELRLPELRVLLKFKVRMECFVKVEVKLEKPLDILAKNPSSQLE